MSPQALNIVVVRLFHEIVPGGLVGMPTGHIRFPE